MYSILDIKFLSGKVTFLLILFSGISYAQIVINEVSQGPSGSKEYVELLVTGDNVVPSCASAPSQCVDVRGMIIDDNNGWHAPGSGTGIAQGAVRFSNDPFWACLKKGSIIVIYNDADLNAAVPAIDLTDANNNCAYVLPITSTTLFQRYSTSPNSTGNDSLYKPNTWTWTNGGSWTNIAMANSDDAFHLVAPGDTNKPVHAVSWGNNTGSTHVYMGAGAATGKVFYMGNTTNNDPKNVANWVNAAAGGAFETPGAANNAANATWINGLTNNCTELCCPKTGTFSNTNISCNGGACVGAINLTVTGNTTPYTFKWNTGATTEDINSLCVGTYTVSVKDANGCDTTFTTSITQPPALALTMNGSYAVCQCPCPGSVWAVPSGGNISVDGSYTFKWSNGPTGFFQNGLCPGTFTVTVTDDKGCKIVGSKTIP